MNSETNNAVQEISTPLIRLWDSFTVELNVTIQSRPLTGGTLGLFAGGLPVTLAQVVERNVLEWCGSDFHSMDWLLNGQPLVKRCGLQDSGSQGTGTLWLVSVHV